MGPPSDHLGFAAQNFFEGFFDWVGMVSQGGYTGGDEVGIRVVSQLTPKCVKFL